VLRLTKRHNFGRSTTRSTHIVTFAIRSIANETSTVDLIAPNPTRNATPTNITTYAVGWNSCAIVVWSWMRLCEGRRKRNDLFCLDRHCGGGYWCRLWIVGIPIDWPCCRQWLLHLGGFFHLRRSSVGRVLASCPLPFCP